MSASNNGFEKDRKRASEAGKKSKRGPSIKTLLTKALESEAPEGIVERLKEQGVNIDKTIFGTMEGVLIAMALGGDLKAIQEIHNRLEGKAVEHIEEKSDQEITVNWPKIGEFRVEDGD